MVRTVLGFKRKIVEIIETKSDTITRLYQVAHSLGVCVCVV
jgi:hypothetical protein